MFSNWMKSPHNAAHAAMIGPLMEEKELTLADIADVIETWGPCQCVQMYLDTLDPTKSLETIWSECDRPNFMDFWLWNFLGLEDQDGYIPDDLDDRVEACFHPNKDLADEIREYWPWEKVKVLLAKKLKETT